MPRNMSFAMTTPQLLDESKDITRRLGWWFLKEGDILNAVNKVMGFKKGEKPKRLKQIQIISTTKEPLNSITQADVIREGFPHFTPQQFVDMLVNHYKVSLDVLVNRIEFKYIKSLF